MNRRHHRAVAAAAALALVVAACGGDDDEAGSDDTTASAETAGAGTTAAATAATTAGVTDTAAEDTAAATSAAGTTAADDTVAVAATTGTAADATAPDATTTDGTAAEATTADATTTDGTAAEATTAGEGTAATEGTAAGATAPDGTTDAGGTAAGSAGAGDGTSGSDWTVNTDDCTDPGSATAPIEGSVHIGMVAPLSGGPAATAFAPVTLGMQAYIDYANENELLPGYELQLSIVDDQYNPALTPGVVNGLLDEGVDLFSGNIGSPQNLSVMDLLNEECVPQMNALSGLDEFGADVDAHPWTFGGQMDYADEARAYVKTIGDEFGEDATAAVFFTNSEFGQTYLDAVHETQDEFGVEIVAEQSVEATDTAPPTAQVNAIAAEAPAAVIAVPLGAGCPVFLAELANAKAAHPGWDPKVYITNTCNSSLILAAAGEAANGIYTAAWSALMDVANPETHTLPGVAEYVEAITAAGDEESIATAAAGWNTGENTVEVLRRAAESEGGLTRAAIIEAARNLDFHPSLAREGANARMRGADDGFLYETIQIIQYDQPNGVWNDVGELIHEFETE